MVSNFEKLEKINKLKKEDFDRTICTEKKYRGSVKEYNIAGENIPFLFYKSHVFTLKDTKGVYWTKKELINLIRNVDINLNNCSSFYGYVNIYELEDKLTPVQKEDILYKSSLHIEVLDIENISVTKVKETIGVGF